jgi:bifunctional non-homologous end joining protein LigD
VSAYAKTLAVEAEAEHPELVVHRMTRSLRPGKVFVDFSQNAAAKTTATPYTLRARPEPTVSAPVTWEEVEACTDARELTFLADDIAPRLELYGDLLGPLINPNRAGRVP